MAIDKRNYNVDYTDPTKQLIKVIADTIAGPNGGVKQVDIDLIGMGHSLWGEAVLENFLHLLENFSCREDLHDINLVEAGGTFFKVLGDVTKTFIVGETFTIVGSSGSPGNDGTYAVSAISTFDGIETTITVGGSPGLLDPASSGGQAGHPDFPDKNLKFSPVLPVEGQSWFNQTKQELYVYRASGSPATFKWDSLGLLQFLLDSYYNRTYVDTLESDLTQLIAKAAPVGSVKEFAGTFPPTEGGWLLCDGSEHDPVVEPDLFAVIGTTYNTGGETPGWFRTPDMRGRVPIGLNPGGTGPNVGTGVKLHLPAQTLGGNDGAEFHTLNITETPSHVHSVSTNTIANHTHAGSTNTNGGHTHTGSTASAGNHTHTQRLNYRGIDGHGPGEGVVNTGFGFTTAYISTTGAHVHSFTGMSTNGSHAHSFTTGAAGGHSHIVTESSIGGGQTHENTQPFLVLNFIIKT